MEEEQEEKKVDDYGELETILPHFLYSREYIGSFINLLRRHNVKTVLDCACAAGYPAFELQKAGFDVMCSDPSGLMIQKLREQIKKQYAHIPHFPVDLTELTKIGLQFDAILCRGNALIYIDSWIKNTIGDNVKEKMKQALKEMYDSLSPTGILYIDITSQREINEGPKLTQDLGERVYDGKRMHMRWEITHDWDSRVRFLRSFREIDGEVISYDYYSYLLKVSELVEMCKEVGFTCIEQFRMPGEVWYDTFLCHK